MPTCLPPCLPPRLRVQDDLARQYGDFMQEKSTLVSRHDKEVRALRDALASAHNNAEEKAAEALQRVREEHRDELVRVTAEADTRYTHMKTTLEQTVATHLQVGRLTERGKGDEE